MVWLFAASLDVLACLKDSSKTSTGTRLGHLVTVGKVNTTKTELSTGLADTPQDLADECDIPWVIHCLLELDVPKVPRALNVVASTRSAIRIAVRRPHPGVVHPTLCILPIPVEDLLVIYFCGGHA